MTLKTREPPPLPAHRVMIPKPGWAGEQRRLSFPTVRDRVVQAAVKLVIGPVFEADFLSCSFGFRWKRSTHDALQVLLMSPGEASAGWSKRTSRTALKGSRMTS
jgi:RNA-directed DNA polymerase